MHTTKEQSRSLFANIPPLLHRLRQLGIQTGTRAGHQSLDQALIQEMQPHPRCLGKYVVFRECKWCNEIRGG